MEATTISKGKEQILRRFPNVFNGLGKLGEPYSYCIQLRQGARPHFLFTARNVPIALREQVKKEINRMDTLGVITKVEVPTPWCSAMVVVPKKSGEVRIPV